MKRRPSPSLAAIRTVKMLSSNSPALSSSLPASLPALPDQAFLRPVQESHTVDTDVGHDSKSLNGKQTCSIIFDLESTGFAPLCIASKYNRVIQIAAQFVDRASNPDSFDKFVNPGMRIPPMSSAIHKIYDKDVIGACDFGTVVKEFFQFCKVDKYDEIELIAHNSTHFDEILFRRQCHEHQVDVPINIKFWDTLPFARERFPGLRSYRLSDLFTHFTNTTMENAHRAGSDVSALREIYIQYILPARAFEIMQNERTDLESLRYIKRARASMINDSLHIYDRETLSRHWISKTQTDPRSLDSFLKTAVRIKDASQRIALVSEILRVPITTEMVNKYVTKIQEGCDCIDAVCAFTSYVFAGARYGREMFGQIRLGKKQVMAELKGEEQHWLKHQIELINEPF